MLARLLSRLFGRQLDTADQVGQGRGNDAVRRALQQAGDDGREPRHVLHYVYPDTNEDEMSKQRAEATLAEFGFSVKPAVEHGGLVAEHHAAVAGGKFDQLTLEVSTAMREIGWKYDGWECAVIAKESRS
jgi:hypothetical protein